MLFSWLFVTFVVQHRERLNEAGTYVRRQNDLIQKTKEAAEMTHPKSGTAA